MLTKEKIISGIMKLPDAFTIDDILDQIILMEKIKKDLSSQIMAILFLMRN